MLVVIRKRVYIRNLKQIIDNSTVKCHSALYYILDTPSSLEQFLTLFAYTNSETIVCTSRACPNTDHVTWFGFSSWGVA